MRGLGQRLEEIRVLPLRMRSRARLDLIEEIISNEELMAVKRCIMCGAQVTNGDPFFCSPECWKKARP